MAVLGVDVGGTFTDAVLIGAGELRTAKVRTLPRQEESVLAAALALGDGEIDRFTHGTTVATNALLERKGAQTAFVTTAGFGPIQMRPAPIAACRMNTTGARSAGTTTPASPRTRRHSSKHATLAARRLNAPSPSIGCSSRMSQVKVSPSKCLNRNVTGVAGGPIVMLSWPPSAVTVSGP